MFPFLRLPRSNVKDVNACVDVVVEGAVNRCEFMGTEQLMQSYRGKAPVIPVVGMHGLKEGHNHYHHILGHLAEVFNSSVHFVHMLQHRVVEDHIKSLAQLGRENLRQVQKNFIFKALESACFRFIVRYDVIIATGEIIPVKTPFLVFVGPSTHIGY